MPRPRLVAPALLLALALPALACSRSRPPTPAPSLDAIAEEYVRLVLATGVHDPDTVDAYYGPPEWRAQADAARRPVGDLRARVEGLRAQVERSPAKPGDELAGLRRAYLLAQLRALGTRLAIVEGKRLSFDDEARALYDAVPAPVLEQDLREQRDRLAALLPGEGPIHARYERFRARFVVPPERIDAVFRRALDACRERTRKRLQLPDGERFAVEYVKEKPWSAYNWYKGGFHSLIQLNVELPLHIDRALQLGCHEGYPGHHAYNALLEQHLSKARGWIETTVYALFSPQSTIAEGSANYGVELAFPPTERTAFERDVLFPLAGLDPALADDLHAVQAIVDELRYADTEAARRYLDGRADAETTTRWLEEYALLPPERARQRVRFFDKYRSYVVNYTLGRDLVRRHVEALAGDDVARRWKVFGDMLSSPRVPTTLASKPPA